MSRSALRGLTSPGVTLRRPVRLLGVTLGIGLTVALLAALGSFLASSRDDDSACGCGSPD